MPGGRLTTQMGVSVFNWNAPATFPAAVTNTGKFCSRSGN